MLQQRSWIWPPIDVTGGLPYDAVQMKRRSSV
jgi:hypothetical protein